MNDKDFSKIFHQSSKDLLKGRGDISDNSSGRAEWLTTHYKTYPRLPVLELVRGTVFADFSRVLNGRSSERDFSGAAIDLNEAALLMQYASGVTDTTLADGRPRRTHPSAGGRYPLEMYVINFIASPGFPSGVYHYNIKRHAFEVLEERTFSSEDKKRWFTDEFVDKASVAVIMTALFWRTQNKYGERGYRYVILEAGHIGQNLYLLANALGLKCCVAGTHDKEIEEFLDIDGMVESVVYAIALGK